MSGDQLSDVFHYRGQRYWGPLSVERMERTIEQLDLQPDARVLDVGCGRAELLIRLIERYSVSALGVDRSPDALAIARDQADERGAGNRLELVECDIAHYEASAQSFDLVVWLGGPYIGADFAATLSALATWAKPGAYVLFGNGFWSQTPSPEYVDATGLSPGELGDHWANIARARERGLRLLYCGVSGRDEWDDFEGSIHLEYERYAAEHPDAPDPRGRLDRQRRWFDAQQRWGRDTMGFGLYLFRHEP
jgi:SAM-dependent methyltransferase